MKITRRQLKQIIKEELLNEKLLEELTLQQQIARDRANPRETDVISPLTDPEERWEEYVDIGREAVTNPGQESWEAYSRSRPQTFAGSYAGHYGSEGEHRGYRREPGHLAATGPTVMHTEIEYTPREEGGARESGRFLRSLPGFSERIAMMRTQAEIDRDPHGSPNWPDEMSREEANRLRQAYIRRMSNPSRSTAGDIDYFLPGMAHEPGNPAVLSPGVYPHEDLPWRPGYSFPEGARELEDEYFRDREEEGQRRERERAIMTGEWLT